VNAGMPKKGCRMFRNLDRINVIHRGFAGPLIRSLLAKNIQYFHFGRNSKLAA